MAELSFSLSPAAIVGGMDDESPTDLGCRFTVTIGRKTIVVENEYQVFEFARRSAQMGGGNEAFRHFFLVLAVIFIGNSYICSQVFAQSAMPFAVRGR